MGVDRDQDQNGAEAAGLHAPLARISRMTAGISLVPAPIHGMTAGISLVRTPIPWDDCGHLDRTHAYPMG